MENNSYSGKSGLVFWIYLGMQLLQNAGDTVGWWLRQKKGENQREASLLSYTCEHPLGAFPSYQKGSDIVSVRWQIRETMKTVPLSLTSERNPKMEHPDEITGIFSSIFAIWRSVLGRKARQPTPVFLSGESHGQRSLAGYSPWGHKESDTTEWPKHTEFCIFKVWNVMIWCTYILRMITKTRIIIHHLR